MADITDFLFGHFTDLSVGGSSARPSPPGVEDARKLLIGGTRPTRVEENGRGQIRLPESMVLHPEFIIKDPIVIHKKVKKSGVKGDHYEDKNALPPKPESKKSKRKKHGPILGPSKADA
ncbi:hypothetical protein QJS10_CPB22g00245 [Acorus calamus]|uniref:Uncharacterized protein n=1 Tax=Acorus calamus TaxID=4465 RepID=A0AAV9C001_ACOCL|nr:hypothetical protein QJS10_CPB22g00245 [Acorus calamus]